MAVFKTWSLDHPITPTDLDRYEVAADKANAAAPKASPALTGTPIAPTAAPGTNTTQVATTAFVGTAVSNSTTVDYRIYKTAKDGNGIFTTVEQKRNDDTLFARSVLSGGTSPKYTTRTITYYDTNGTTLLKTTTRTLSYDVDGALISEV